MTQEQEDLLLKDLCARLPYGVILNCCEIVSEPLTLISYKGLVNNDYDIDEVKPYLFPLSSMTEEQKNELREMEWSFDNSTICNIIECFGTYRAYVDHSCCSELIDWFIKNHIDYRGLIPMGLANDATGLNIY